MNLKEEYIKKLKSSGLDTTNLYIEDLEEKSIVSFIDEINGETFVVTMNFYKEDYNYRIVISKKIKVIDKLNVLEKINNYNRICYRMTFFLENNKIYGIRSYERYKGDSQEFIDNIAVLYPVLTSTGI